MRSPTEPDGIEFHPGSVEAARIKEGADYEGVRVTFTGTLARARIPMQIDIGFGDVIVPAPTHVEYPTLLDFSAPVLLAYPKETVVAEKLEALTKLGLLNSRMKDYYDLGLLSRLYSFSGALLVKAVRATFGRLEAPSRSNRLALREPTTVTPQDLCSGTPFFAEAGVCAPPCHSSSMFFHPSLEGHRRSQPTAEDTPAGNLYRMSPTQIPEFPARVEHELAIPDLSWPLLGVLDHQ